MRNVQPTPSPVAVDAAHIFADVVDDSGEFRPDGTSSSLAPSMRADASVTFLDVPSEAVMAAPRPAPLAPGGGGITTNVRINNNNNNGARVVAPVAAPAADNINGGGSSSSAAVAAATAAAVTAPDQKQHAPPPPEAAAISSSSVTCTLIAITLATVNESVASNMPISFIGNFVSLVSGQPVSSSGFISGALIAIFHLGQMLSGTWWGAVGDRFGRRPVILIGLFASMCSQLAFGFASTIWLCFVIRFLQGLFNGNMATIKAVVSEVTDKSNEAFGFSLLTLAWGLGTLASMSIGGLLYDPVNQWHLFRNTTTATQIRTRDILLEFPALAPCAVGALYDLFSLCVLAAVMAETNKRVALAEAAPPPEGRWWSCGGNWRRWCPSSVLACCCCGGGGGGGGGAVGAIAVATSPEAASPAASTGAGRYDVLSVVEGGGGGGGAPSSPQSSSASPPGVAVRSPGSDKQHPQPTSKRSRRPSRSSSPDYLSAAAAAQRRRSRDAAILLDGIEVDDLVLADIELVDSGGVSDSDVEMQPVVTATVVAESAAVAAVAAASHGRHDQTTTTDAAGAAASSSPAGGEPKRLGIRGALAIPQLRAYLLGYMALAVHDIAYAECFPLLAILHRSLGGFEMSVARLGVLNSVGGVTQIFANSMFPVVHRLLGEHVYPVFGAVVAVAVTATPFAVFVIDSPKLFAAAILSIMVVRHFAISFQYTNIALGVKNNAPRKYLGEVTGLAQSSASFVRIITPALAAPLFAFTAESEVPLPHPYNTSLVFVLCGVVAMWSSLYTARSQRVLHWFVCCLAPWCYRDDGTDGGVAAGDGSVLVPDADASGVDGADGGASNDLVVIIEDPAGGGAELRLNSLPRSLILRSDSEPPSPTVGDGKSAKLGSAVGGEDYNADDDDGGGRNDNDFDDDDNCLLATARGGAASRGAMRLGPSPPSAAAAGAASSSRSRRHRITLPSE